MPRPSRFCFVLLAVVMIAAPAAANPPDDPSSPRPVAPSVATVPGVSLAKEIDQPDPEAYRRMRTVRRWREWLERQDERPGLEQLRAAASLARTGSEHVLVILVEFDGSDTFTWTAGQSTWDPLGLIDASEAVYDPQNNLVIGDCSRIITQTTQFTYSGPLHNQIERPRAADDASGNTVWTTDFGVDYYRELFFGDGVTLSYQRQDGSPVNESFAGKSVRDYIEDMSGGKYSISGDVVGWVQVPHSVWWYGADACPGRRSGGSSEIADAGAIPGTGSEDSLAVDALEAVKAAYPGFDFARYDRNGDGLIDHLWIVHAGYGEEMTTTLLGRTNYGEAQIWSQANRIEPPHPVAPGVSARRYTMLPENAGISVTAHEFLHTLGTIDLYAYTGGDTSSGFWSIMDDTWTGYPIAMVPSALDPWHQDGLGWLDPLVIVDPSQEYTVKVGQASAFPGGEGVYRGVKIRLPDGRTPLPVQPQGSWQWWGGKDNLLNSKMTAKQAIVISPAGATLSFKTAFEIEPQWDFLWVQISDDGGATWNTLTNANTSCIHDPSWIGEQNGFPADLCGAGLGGFSGKSPGFPAHVTESFDLSAWAGQSVLLRFWYMTDWGYTDAGPFIDDVAVTSGVTTLFSDGAEAGGGNWDYADNWARVTEERSFAHSYYLQWRNVSATGGYDRALADSRWRFGPANTGLVVWYNSELYSENEVTRHLQDPPGFGPKGRMLVVDAHPQPYRSPYMVGLGWNNEAGNTWHRGQMRDAPFSIRNTNDFTFEGYDYSGRPGVFVFDDALGYYPGAESVLRGAGYDPPEWFWATRQWDASTLVPSMVDYGIKAPGYVGNQPFHYRCGWATGSTTTCTTLAGGLGYDGGAGNPGDVGGAYGWKVEILSESDSQATVRISNSNAGCTLSCETTVGEVGQLGVPVPFAVNAVATNCPQPIAYDWSFGDGAPNSSLQNPLHAFVTIGMKEWWLRATTGSQSCTREGSITIIHGPEVTVLRGVTPITDGQAAAVGLGSVPQGVAGPVASFTVRNDGDAVLTVGVPVLPPGFTLIEPPVASLTPGQQGTFSVRLDSSEQGEASGQIVIATNDADESSFGFPLHGTVGPPLSRFDFGTGVSPVAPGFIGVAAGTRYGTAQGFGWNSGSIDARDRGGSHDLRRDLNVTRDASFAVDLPNGMYDVSVTMGDSAAGHDQMGVSLQGGLVGSLTAAKGQFASETWRTSVWDGRLTVQIEDLGGSDTNAVINALKVTPVWWSRFDFGTATSPVASSWQKVTPATAYSAVLGYGWVAGNVDSRDRAAGNDYRRDLNFTRDATFAVDVPFGTYLVRAFIGDASAAHDQMGLFFEGVQHDVITTTAGGVIMRLYRVAVADGQLTVRLADLGGGDANAVIQALSLWQCEARQFDLGAEGSPVAPGWTQMVPADAYDPAFGFGWTRGAVAARDRGSGGPLVRDFNFTRDGELAVDLPDASYDISVAMGDASAAHEDMALSLEGAQVDVVTTAAGETAWRTHRLVVGDGQLTVGLADLGGADVNVVLNGLEVLATGTPSFDFGTLDSPVAEGWQRVAPTTTYTPWRGFGFDSGGRDSRDRGAGSDMSRDFVLARWASFVADVLPGTWDVTVSMGDRSCSHDQMLLYLEGELAATVSKPANQYHVDTYRVVVADGLLDVVLEDGGGSDANAVINGLSLARVGAARFDFGTVSSPVAAGFARVSEKTAYSVDQGYGWAVGTVASRDRGMGTALTRDLNFATNATFLLDLPNGTYDVTVTFGDASASHDEMGVFLEGSRVDTLTVAKGQHVTRTTRVVVSDGQLTVQIRDLGGSDANAVINALEVR